jgi:hypothetical protein
MPGCRTFNLYQKRFEPGLARAVARRWDAGLWAERAGARAVSVTVTWVAAKKRLPFTRKSAGETGSATALHHSGTAAGPSRALA